MIQRAMTAQEFSLKRSELPDAGQWAELIRGVPVVLQPPDLEHGNLVLNFSKAFSAYVHAEEYGYPCFDLGLKLESAPDTILFPAISYFTEGERFSEMDKDYTEAAPRIVVELASTNDRRSNINERTALYHQMGTSAVWIVDPHTRTIHIVRNGANSPSRLTDSDTLTGAPDLKGFQVAISDLFAEPKWA